MDAVSSMHVHVAICLQAHLGDKQRRLYDRFEKKEQDELACFSTSCRGPPGPDEQFTGAITEGDDRMDVAGRQCGLGYLAHFASRQAERNQRSIYVLHKCVDIGAIRTK